MDVILLERVAKLGQMGEVVSVKDGYARNFLLPQKKALRANDSNIKAFENRKAQLEAQNLETKSEAEALAAKLDGQQFTSSAPLPIAARFMAPSPHVTRPMRPPKTASASTASRLPCRVRSRTWACTRACEPAPRGRRGHRAERGTLP
jgi:hypothetical protein